jgi:hypothetical protein
VNFIDRQSPDFPQLGQIKKMCNDPVKETQGILLSHVCKLKATLLIGVIYIAVAEGLMWQSRSSRICDGMSDS